MTNESIEEEDEKTGQTDLTFKLDFPGNLCRAAFAILAMFFNIPLSYTAGKHRCDSRGGAGWGLNGQRRCYSGLPLVPRLAARSRVST